VAISDRGPSKRPLVRLGYRRSGPGKATPAEIRPIYHERRSYDPLAWQHAVHSVSTTGRPGANRTRACSVGGSRPIRWTTGRWETRRESNPTGGFADRLSPGESRAMVLPPGVEPGSHPSDERQQIRYRKQAE
jgi:hypothetical protein